MGVPAHGVRVRQPADEGGQFAVFPRPEHQVSVIALRGRRAMADSVAPAGHPVKEKELRHLVVSSRLHCPSLSSIVPYHH
jgi:hypothetical protein